MMAFAYHSTFSLPERGIADHTLSLVSNKPFETVGGSAVVQRSR